MAEKRPRRRERGEAKRRGTARRRLPLVPWRNRARKVVDRLRDFARERQEEVLEEYLRERFKQEEKEPDVADLQRAFDDFVCAPGTAGEGRSLVRAFAEEAPDLDAAERRDLPRWEQERRRRVYLLDRGQRDRLHLWEPVEGTWAEVHLLDRLTPAQAIRLRRGAVAIAVTVPWAERTVALGRVEMYEDEEAIALYRREVVNSGRIWHDLPRPVPGR